MKFSCPNCKLTGSIDDAKLPEQGLYAGCPQCKTRFLVKKQTVIDPLPGPLQNTSAATVNSPDVQTVAGQNNSESVNMGSVRPQSGERRPPARSNSTASTANGRDLTSSIKKSSDAKTQDIKTEPKQIDISTLPTSDSWKVKFHLFQKAGGATLAKLKDLSGKERMKINFNVLAFLFGPIYYVFKGMWKKGLTLFACCMTVIFIITLLLELAGIGHLSKGLRYGVAAIFAVRANVDYYKKMVLNQNGWW